MTNTRPRFRADRISHYLVTGVDRSGRRFRISTPVRMHAHCINLWNGSVWAVDTNGTRKLEKRVRN